MGFARDEGVVRCDCFVGTAHVLVLSKSLGVEGRTVLPLLAVHASDPVGELSIISRTYWEDVLWEHTAQSCLDCSHWWEGYGQLKQFHFCLTSCRRGLKAYVEAAPGLAWKAGLCTGGADMVGLSSQRGEA